MSSVTMRCTAQRPNGTFCDRLSLPGAPFPICVKHAAKLYEFISGVVADEPLQAEPTPDYPVVYYLQVGSFIKIGTTISMTRRMKAYPPDSVLLASEPGGADLERARLAQFRDDRAGGREWFAPSAPLMAHIKRLRSA